MGSHFFKIVYIQNLKELEPVPHMWEEDGVCWFPKLKNEIKMHQCNAASLPDKKHLRVEARHHYYYYYFAKASTSFCKM